MPRYAMELLVYPDDREGSESTVKTQILAPNKQAAIRSALERAWYNEMNVSRFLSINVIPQAGGMA